MSISEKIENENRNQIKIIKSEKNKITRMKLIGSLALDNGEKNCVSAIAKITGHSRKYIKKCIDFVENDCKIQMSIEFRGRKKIIEKYPTLEKDITKIIENFCLTDPKFKTEKRYVRLSIKEIKKQLIETGKYNDKSFSNSSLNNIVNSMGYNLKKVQKTKPLKKIDETDAIFDNVHTEKEKAMLDDKTVLISIDTKDKILIGPFSRRGKNRVQIEAVDHELTTNCTTPFGILDIKKSQPFIFNFKGKPTSLDMVDCIEEFLNKEYSDVKVDKLCILLDNGPDNSGVRTIFLKGLVELAKKCNIKIELIYYPPYHSKYNPIERLWARLENIWNGFLIETIDICMHFMENLTWKENLAVAVLKDSKYEKGMKVEKKEMKELEKKHIVRKEGIEKWGVLITP